jgi:hypothetical protein
MEANKEGVEKGGFNEENSRGKIKWKRLFWNKNGPGNQAANVCLLWVNENGLILESKSPWK